MQIYPKPDPATLLEFYRRMTLIRQNDDKSHKVIKSGRVAIPYYSPKVSIGV